MSIHAALRTWPFAVAVAIAAVAGVAFAPARAAVASTAPAPARPAAPGVRDHIVIVGISGLTWSDVSQSATPALWRVAGEGSAGSLVDRGVLPLTCPGDAWLTLNAGDRAMAPHRYSGPCPALPAVTAESDGTARIPDMPSLVSYNKRFPYSPHWGTLAAASGAASGAGGSSGADRCATAVGPGAALALADARGNVGSYVAAPSGLSRQALARCALTVVDLGALPARASGNGASGNGASGNGASGDAARSAALRAIDAELAHLVAGLPAGATLLLTAPGAVDRPPHLQVTVVAGPGYHAGLLGAESTKQPGLVVLIDLTSTVLRWRGRSVPAGLAGRPLTRSGRAGLAATVAGLAGRDTAERVWTTTHNWFFWTYALADAAVFAGIGLFFWGGQEERRRRRARLWRLAGVFAAAVPVGTFLADLTPWWLRPHPAAWLYGLALGWAAIAAAAALLGPWRRDPIGPLGALCLLTLGVLGVDVITGSRLQLETPFGLSVLEAGRFYGIGNEALGIYAIAGLAGAAWLGIVALRRQAKRAAVLSVSAVALFAVVASGWPGTGSKAGGTIVMVPCFLLLLAAVAGIKVSWRRAALIAVSGLAVLALFALLNYLVPATGSSDLGSFAGNLLHGQGGGLLHRKVSANVGSLTVNSYSPLIPLTLAVAGLILWRPSWFGVRTVPRAFLAEPLMRVTTGLMWLAAVLGWLANDSGIIVPAAALPLALPLGIALLAAVSCQPRDAHMPGEANGAAPDDPRAALSRRQQAR